MTPDPLTEALCREYPHLFFAPERPVGGGPAWSPEPGLALCRVCPSLVPCRRQAIHYGDIDVKGRAVHGVIGGVAPPAPVRIGRPAPTMRRCEAEGCRERFFVIGSRDGRYCSPACVRAARTASKRASRARLRAS